MKQRLDTSLVLRKLVRSRSEGVQYIDNGFVLVNGVVKTKSSYQVDDVDEIVVTQRMRYVSRAGDKLEHALEHFDLLEKVSGKTCLDIGSSTGGFTDCLLQHGAHTVTSVDVGTEQLDISLRNHPQIYSHEQTDIREFVIEKIFDIVVVDVSFISLSHIMLSVSRYLSQKGFAIILIKPQFEVGKAGLGKGGLVHPDKHERVCMDVSSYAEQAGLRMIQITTSPILGGSGNIEFLMYLVKK